MIEALMAMIPIFTRLPAVITAITAKIFLRPGS
jgi:hypothetical protein